MGSPVDLRDQMRAWGGLGEWKMATKYRNDCEPSYLVTVSSEQRGGQKEVGGSYRQITQVHAMRPAQTIFAPSPNLPRVCRTPYLLPARTVERHNAFEKRWHATAAHNIGMPHTNIAPGLTSAERLRNGVVPDATPVVLCGCFCHATQAVPLKQTMTKRQPHVVGMRRLPLAHSTRP